MMILLLIVSPQTTVASTPTGLYFSNELDVGDKFTWLVEKNNKDGENVVSGIFKIGAQIQVEVIGSTEAYNHYTLFAEDDLFDIFKMTIDDSSYNPIFVIDFIIPVIFNYSNGTSTNFLEEKVSEIILEDKSKINTTRIIVNGIYKERFQVFVNNTNVNFSLDSQFEVSTGALHLLSIESDVLKLKIVRDYENQIEGKNSSDNLSFNMVFSALGVSIAIFIIKTKQKGNK